MGLALLAPHRSMPAKITKKVWQKTEAPVKGTVAKKAPKYYPAEDVKTKLGNHHNTTKLTKLRASITPGTVLILLAGRFKGCRVVFLKQLDSGLLLISGPFRVNGVPLRRVPQSYVIATKTSVDISGVSIPKEVTDALFTKPKSTKKKSDELFFEKEKETSIDESRKKLQSSVDDKLIAAVKKTPLLEEYLKAKFSLQKGDLPHKMSF